MSDSVRPSRWPAVAVGLPAAGCSFLLWAVLEQWDHDRVVARLMTGANIVRAHIPDSLDPELRALAQAARRPFEDAACWAREADTLRAEHPFLETIARLAPDGRILQVASPRPEAVDQEYPVAGILPGAPPSVTWGPRAGRRTPGFRAVLPDRDGGFVAAVFAFEPRLARTLESHAPELAVEVRDNDVVIFRRGGDPDPALASWTKRSAVEIHGIVRTLSIWPEESMLSALRSPLPAVTLGLGLTLSGLLGFAVHVQRLARAKARVIDALNTGLEHRVAQATASLQSELDARRAAEARAEDLYENAPDGFVTLERPGGAVLKCNRTFAAALGLARDEIAGRPFVELVAPDALPAARAGFNAFLSDGTARDVPVRFLRQDGSRLDVLLNLSSDRSGNANGVVRDVSQLRELEDQLRQAQKMEAVGRLAGGIAHDFNNLLTVILGFADLAQAQLTPGTPEAASIEEIREAGRRAADLTGKLLTFSRKRIIRPRPLDLNEVVRGLDAMLRRLIGERVELLLALDPAVGPVLADEGQVEQVIVNLVVNARDAMPEGGRVYVESLNVDLDSSSGLRHEGEPVEPGPYVLLAVSDTGTGMAPEVRQRAFEPFFTTKEQGKGTGLGLATVYAIVKQARGYIWIYSEPGRGTAVKIYLPRLRRPHPEEATAAVPPLPAAGGREVVLLAEDEDALRRLAASQLRSAGHVVLEAASGEEALRVARAHAGAIHLLLTDAVMPGIQGSDLARQLRAERPGLRVLLMSGYTGTVALDQGLLEREGAFLQKPFTRDALLARVRAALEAAKPTTEDRG